MTRLLLVVATGRVAAHSSALLPSRLRLASPSLAIRACASDAAAAVAKKPPAAKPPAAKGGASQGLTPRATDYSAWYNEVIAAGELVDQSPVKGCMVLKPHGMALWDAVRDELDGRIKRTGARNAYFPLFIPVSFLSKEAEHVDGFAKECAVVTHHRLRATAGGKGVEPDPEAELEEPLIVRPTSETMIWHMFSKWIQSYRDLPLKVNQWANVVRWELRTRPFLRTSEFLWQEGHTAHASSEEALGCARQMLDVYADLCRELLAVPVVKGVKSATERFAGAEETFTIEALMQNGWALQSGTSHFLGQNFAKAFDVQFQTQQNEQELVWATSWGVSTRLIGALVMTHSDDLGLVLPPALAPVQVVIVPISPKGPEKDPEGHGALMDFVMGAAASMEKAGVRVEVDTRFNLRPGNKFYEWERKGVPIRVEAGPRDMAAGSVLCARRAGGDGEKFKLEAGEGLGAAIAAELDFIQAALLAAAEERLEAGTQEVESYAEMVEALADSDGTSAPGFFLVPWHDDAEVEKQIKTETKATIRCYPIAEQARAEGRVCFHSGRPATHMALFARAF
eukprot:CAMPEP_0195610946 /NCGR_PEP_ID=MMETSP0815-20121206/10079_1 /TAXON_ID=97485 /ORGANISM="Prymnesium parvum, Strain Texoma1" /LENGTH=566 /DNA_ID=CAMNT_0040750967 /DNA_START=9 /DNA_END=1709 /DNA_ORIENTATION=-